MASLLSIESISHSFLNVKLAFHLTEKVAFTSSNNSFASTGISYFKNRFCANANKPSINNVAEEKESKL